MVLLSKTREPFKGANDEHESRSLLPGICDALLIETIGLHRRERRQHLRGGEREDYISNMEIHTITLDIACAHPYYNHR